MNALHCVVRQILALLATPEELVSTTLLVLPFAFPDFEEFYAFSLDLENEFMPQVNKEHRPVAAKADKGNNGKEKPSLKKLLSKDKILEQEKSSANDIQVRKK